MKFLEIQSVKSFSCQLDNIASDKSISHRCAMFSLLAKSPSVIGNFLLGEDTLHSLQIAQCLGATIENLDSTHIKITPPSNIKEPSEVLDCGNAGTGMRLWAGLLASQSGFFVLSGDKYLNARPMNRIIEPLNNIGAKIFSRHGGFAPLGIQGQNLKGFNYESKIPSAQVKSALILAALNADKTSVYKESELSRDHTEKMLKGMGAKIDTKLDSGVEIKIEPLESKLNPLEFEIPADPSSAFFFAVAAAISENSKIVLKNVLLNKTRIEAYEVLRKMGAKVEYKILDSSYEDIGDIEVCANGLKGIKIDSNMSWLIDELPALSIAMALADGISEVRNAKELRVKESDRIKAVLENLARLGVKFIEYEDGYKIYGGEFKSDSKPIIESFGDHRIAMSFAIAGLKIPLVIKDSDCISVSFPNFVDLLNKITTTKEFDAN